MSSMFCKKVYTCKNNEWCARDFNPKSDDPECFEVLTNYDHIKEYSPEQLAGFMSALVFGDYEPYKTIRGCLMRGELLDWLSRPARE